MPKSKSTYNKTWSGLVTAGRYTQNAREVRQRLESALHRKDNDRSLMQYVPIDLHLLALAEFLDYVKDLEDRMAVTQEFARYIRKGAS